MNGFNIGKTICDMRRAAGLTQEALADKLGLSYQAVSKWENGLSCPDLSIIPTIAEIFGTDINTLFGFAPKAETPCTLPWENDDNLYIAVFEGHTLVEKFSPQLRDEPIIIQGDARNINSTLNLHIEGSVMGDVTAGGNIYCENIEGDASAGGRINIDIDKDFRGMKGHFVLDFDDMSPEEQEKCREIKEKADEISKNAENISKNALNFTKRILDAIGKGLSDDVE
ncbi:MAG: helix-turn-helix transcriptional regulator [Oscillospiraceae bacterium]|nr:helix-turn-helix transcriptional regulator [Oscillospiraceae bacterium]